MGLLPENHAARIAFFQSRIATWTAEATNIGTTTTQVTDVSTKADAAAAALAAQQTAQNAAKSATATLLQAMEALTSSGMIVIEQVRTKSRTAGDAVFPLADLPVPATPQPKGKPGTPYQFKVGLKPNGALELAWKCNNPAGSQGTFYYVFRKFSTTAPFEFIGAAGQRDFIDSTVPAGTATIVYQIQGARTSALGDAAEFIVNLGVSSAGATTVSVTEGTPAPKLAA